MIVGSIMLGPGMLTLLVGYYVGMPYRRTVYSTHVEFHVSATEAAGLGG